MVSRHEAAARLRCARAYAGLRQPEISALLNISTITLKRLERGHSRSPTEAELLLVGRHCGVPDTFMLTGWAEPDIRGRLLDGVVESLRERRAGLLAERDRVAADLRRVRQVRQALTAALAA